MQREAEHLNAGLDGEWLTADDHVEYVRETAYDGAGNWTRTVIRKSTGPDGVWGNDDDFILDCPVATFDDHGRPTGSLNYRTGLDLQPFTADDFLGGRDELVYSDTGDVRLESHYDSPGPDGIWLTGDDLVTRYQAYEYDAVTGRLVRIVAVVGAGPDGACSRRTTTPGTTSGPSTTPRGCSRASRATAAAWTGAHSPRTTSCRATRSARRRRTAARSKSSRTPLARTGIWFTADDVATRTTSFDPDL